MKEAPWVPPQQKQDETDKKHAKELDAARAEAAEEAAKEAAEEAAQLRAELALLKEKNE